MLSTPPLHGDIRFGVFEVDARARELRKKGSRVKLQQQPFELLMILLEHPGQVVSREELRQRLWPADVYVDFDRGLNKAMVKLREALGDSSDSPRFIETLPRVGYRFLGTLRNNVESAIVSEPPAELERIPTAKTSQPAARQITANSILWGGMALVTLCLLGWLLRPNRPERTVFAPVPFTSYPGTETAPAFSPDGSRIAFAWDGGVNKSGTGGFDLYVKAIGSETLLRLTNNPSDFINPTWSPDGTQIAFHRMAGSDTGIYVVPALGGAERKLRVTHVPDVTATPISWSSDGKWIAYEDSASSAEGNRMFMVSPATLENQSIPHNPECVREAQPTFSHSGGDFAYLCERNAEDFRLYSLSVKGGKPRLVSELSDFVMGITWSADDSRLIVAPTTNWVSDLAEVPVAGGKLRSFGLPLNPSAPTASRVGGRLAYSTAEGTMNIWRKDLLHPLDEPTRLIASSRVQTDAHYSPDGKHIAFISTRAGMVNVWVSDADGKNPVQMADLDSGSEHPQWSPDSQKIVFAGNHAGHHAVYIVDIAERVAHKLVTNVSESDSPDWSRDGKWIYFRSFEEPGHKFYRSPAVGGDAVLLSPHDAVQAMESVDGRFLYFSEREMNAELKMISLDGKLTETDIAEMPTMIDFSAWTIAPGGIYYIPAAAPTSVAYFDTVTRKSRQVFQQEKQLGYGLSVSADGRYMLFSQVDSQNADIMLLEHFD